MRSRLFLVAVAALLPAFAPVPFPRRERKGGDDLPRLQGTWKVVRYERDGKDWMQQGVATLWKVDRDRIQNFRVLPGGVEQLANTYVLRLDQKKSPRSIDLVQNGSATWGGSYQIENKRWRMVLVPPGGPRPTRFSSAGAFLIEAERQPDERAPQPAPP